jgi:hypothetical protein
VPVARGATPAKGSIGKSSVSSELFETNYFLMIERVKEILRREEAAELKVSLLRKILNVRDKENTESNLLEDLR